MNSYPKEPNPGDRISAQLIRDIIRCLRRITPLAGPGVKANVTPNGTHLTAAATAKTTSASASPGCWHIGVDDSDPSEPRKMLVNRYFQIGGDIRELTQEEANTCYIDIYVPHGDLPEPEEGEEQEEYTEDDKPFIALIVSMYEENFGYAHVDGFHDLDELKAEAAKKESYVKPLYQLTHDGKVKIDLRNMPQLSAMEF